MSVNPQTLDRMAPSKRLQKPGVRFNRILWKFIVYVLIIGLSVVFLVPFFWMLSTALKDASSVFAIPMQWIPNPAHWDNFTTTLTQLPFGQWFINTCIITFSTIVGTVLSCTLVAYGFARFHAPGRHVLFVILLATMMLPGAVTMIPTFVLFKDLGWINTYYPLIVPSFFGNAFFIFMLRQFFLTLPVELEDAAKIDGLGTLGTLWRVILPLSLPAMATVAIYQFNGAWNDFMGPLIYLNRPEQYTLALGINFFKSQNNIQWNYLMAGSTLIMIPSLIFFFIGQKWFVNSISMTGIKG